MSQAEIDTYLEDYSDAELEKSYNIMMWMAKF